MVSARAGEQVVFGGDRNCKQAESRERIGGYATGCAADISAWSCCAEQTPDIPPRKEAGPKKLAAI